MKKLFIFLILGITLIGILSFVSATTIVLRTPNTENLDDSYVNPSAPDTNYGTNTTMLFTVNNPMYIKYNTTLINGATITSSELYFFNVPVGGNINFYVYKVNEDSPWAEETITYNNQPCPTNCSSEYQFGTDTSDQYQINGTNLTNLIQYVADNNLDEISFYINSTLAPSSTALATKESATDGFRPKLTIVYTEDVVNVSSKLHLSNKLQLRDGRFSLYG